MFETLWICCCLGASVPSLESGPKPLDVPHFPSRLHAFVWRNWSLVDPERMASTLGAETKDILRIGRSMGLQGPAQISEDAWRRSYITILRRNWHLLSTEQLLELLGWTAEELSYCLREDDFLFIKLGSLKPSCERLCYEPPSKEQEKRAAAIAHLLEDTFPDGAGLPKEPLFGFLTSLNKPVKKRAENPIDSLFSPRYCYSYFALYGDPLLDLSLDPYPDPYLERLAASGANGVWLQAVLYRLVPFPWDLSLSEGYEQRLENLKALVQRASKKGVGIYLYLNEPRAMPLSFFEKYPELKGVTLGDHAALCTSHPEVQAYLVQGIRRVAEAVPDLAGFFSITASENPTNCWSHNKGGECQRCAPRGPAEVIAEVNALFRKGIDQAGTQAELIAWDWGWGDDWAPAAIRSLPKNVSFMSVSEWSIPIQRGGVPSVVGEYSISEIGPGPRATRHWGIAREHGLKTLAKIQANNTWELSSVPYIPAVKNVAQHISRLRDAQVKGLMLGWTLGGHPSPNLEVVAEMGRVEKPSVEQALEVVAQQRAGQQMASALVAYWTRCSEAFSQYPYHIGTVYNGPQHMGPANLLYATRTGYRATMVGLPYDDLKSWRSVYPPEIFAQQFDTMGKGFQEAVDALKEAMAQIQSQGNFTEDHLDHLLQEIRIGSACSLHFRSVANQVRFVLFRDQILDTKEASTSRLELIQNIERVLRDERDAACSLYKLQCLDSRLGFEASNQYFFVPMDLAEKVLNCTHLLETWLPQVASENP